MDYHIKFFYSDTDGGYIADIPDLEACSAFGETPEERSAPGVANRQGRMDRNCEKPGPTHSAGTVPTRGISSGARVKTGVPCGDPTAHLRLAGTGRDCWPAIKHCETGWMVIAEEAGD